jgi:uncharacterized membrane protein
MLHTPPPPKHVPFIDQIRQELELNLGEGERSLSTLGGAGLIGFGVTQIGWQRWFYVLLGGALLRRGLTGHCDLYERLHIDTRHPTPHGAIESGHSTRLESSIDIRCPARELYLFWRRLDQLPHALRHIESVTPIDGVRSHWIVKGPLGHQFEWDAKIINDQEDQLIAWETLPGASVPNSGSVRFEERGPGLTRIKVAMEFQQPAKAIGLTIAKLLGESPQRELEDDLAAFKGFAERELTPESQSQN